MADRQADHPKNEAGLVNTRKAWAAFCGLFLRFTRDRSAMGAVEFAMIVPLLLMLYITAFEVTIGLSVAKRATRSAGAIADLVTQTNTVDTTVLNTMTDVAGAMFAPYPTTGMSLDVMGITIDSAGRATVTWSWSEDGTAPYAKNKVVTVPADISTPSSFLVHARVSIPYKLLMFMPGLMPAQLQTITISREYYFRQRISSTVTCSNCPSG